MHWLDPELLADLSGLSPSLSGIGLAVGVALWILGWQFHRFWIVIGVTVLGGVAGLCTGRQFGPAMLTVGLLLSLTAGLMALELSRLAAFLAGGLVAWLSVQMIFGPAAEPLLPALVGGLLGLLLYRLWVMMLTGLIGTLLIGYTGLLLAGRILRFDPADFAVSNGRTLDLVVIILALLAVVAQGFFERWWEREPSDEPTEALVENQQDKRRAA